MFEWIVMGFFIGLPALLVVGAFIAWLYHRNQDFSIEDLDSESPQDVSKGSPA